VSPSGSIGEARGGFISPLHAHHAEGRGARTTKLASWGQRSAVTRVVLIEVSDDEVVAGSAVPNVRRTATLQLDFNPTQRGRRLRT